MIGVRQIGKKCSQQGKVNSGVIVAMHQKSEMGKSVRTAAIVIGAEGSRTITLLQYETQNRQ